MPERALGSGGVRSARGRWRRGPRARRRRRRPRRPRRRPGAAATPLRRRYRPRSRGPPQPPRRRRSGSGSGAGGRGRAASGAGSRWRRPRGARARRSRGGAGHRRAPARRGGVAPAERGAALPVLDGGGPASLRRAAAAARRRSRGMPEPDEGGDDGEARRGGEGDRPLRDAYAPASCCDSRLSGHASSKPDEAENLLCASEEDGESSSRTDHPVDRPPRYSGPPRRQRAAARLDGRTHRREPFHLSCGRSASYSSCSRWAPRSSWCCSGRCRPGLRHGPGTTPIRGRRSRGDGTWR